MTARLQRALVTVCYADAFGFPLTDAESHKWMIGGGRFPSHVPGTVRMVSNGTGYVCLTGRRRLLGIREARKAEAVRKWNIAMRISRWFRLVPSVLLCGITGGLAMDNADAGDDIDFFFIVSPGTVWTSRALIVLIAHVTGVRRLPGSRTVTDTACLNMFMDVRSCAVPQSEQDLFSAHEVLQMKPVWDKNGTYGIFLHRNAWAEAFLPNAWRAVRQQSVSVGKNTGDQQGPGTRVILAGMRCVESVARTLQIAYMQKRMTREVVGRDVIRFHPRDARGRIRAALTRRLGKYNIPLDNIFFRP